MTLEVSGLKFARAARGFSAQTARLWSLLAAYTPVAEGDASDPVLDGSPSGPTTGELAALQKFARAQQAAFEAAGETGLAGEAQAVAEYLAHWGGAIERLREDPNADIGR